MDVANETSQQQGEGVSCKQHGKVVNATEKGIIPFVPNNKWRLQKFYILHLINVEKHRQSQLLHIVL